MSAWSVSPEQFLGGKPKSWSVSPEDFLAEPHASAQDANRELSRFGISASKPGAAPPLPVGLTTPMRAPAERPVASPVALDARRTDGVMLRSPRLGPSDPR